jgi:hypothetical protein
VTAERHYRECLEIAAQHGLVRVELAHMPVLAGVSSYADYALALAEQAAAAAEAAGNPRAEFTARQIAMTRHLWCARPQAVEPHFRRVREIADQTGSPRIRAENLTLMGDACRQLGDQILALSFNDEALTLARQDETKILIPTILGARALTCYDDDQIRIACLREGESEVERSIAVNALAFHVCSIDSCLLARDWSEAERYSDLFAVRFSVEPIPLVDFLVMRGRLLSELGRQGQSAALEERLAHCTALGRALGHAQFLELLEKALEG